MRILIIGGQGMAGHMITQYLKKKPGYDVWSTTRNNSQQEKELYLDVLHPEAVHSLLQQVKPDLVINAVGLLNHQADAHLRAAIYVNSLFPHTLAQWGEKMNFRLIHISTDCVFSGKTGGYVEDAVKDGVSTYAKTKSLGEINDGRNVTIRTSIIGPELKRDGMGLFHWFMQQKGDISGYTQVFWNGVTTLELAKAIEWLLQRDITGLVHLAATQKISKYDLLRLIQSVFDKKDVHIKPYAALSSDKSLINTRADFSYTVPSYHTMLEELKEELENKSSSFIK